MNTVSASEKNSIKVWACFSFLNLGFFVQIADCFHLLFILMIKSLNSSLFENKGKKLSAKSHRAQFVTRSFHKVASGAIKGENREKLNLNLQ